MFEISLTKDFICLWWKMVEKLTFLSSFERLHEFVSFLSLLIKIHIAYFVYLEVSTSIIIFANISHHYVNNSLL